MNKYAQLPWGVFALKDFFPSHIHGNNGESVSSSHTKGLIKDLIAQEDKKHPLSDQDIAVILSSKNGLKCSRRTVTKYREELKILSSTFRRVR
jgi:RNA polymerase sigma-54 factor